MYQVLGKTAVGLASSPVPSGPCPGNEQTHWPRTHHISRKRRDSDPLRKQNKYILNLTNLDLNLNCCLGNLGQAVQFELRPFLGAGPGTCFPRQLGGLDWACAGQSQREGRSMVFTLLKVTCFPVSGQVLPPFGS